jgi:hypothetical protein
MFQFSGYASSHMVRDHAASQHGVAPFGYRRIAPCQPVPCAFRRLPRPSSPGEAKASPGCPFAALPPKGSTTAGCYQSIVVCTATPSRRWQPLFSIGQRTTTAPDTKSGTEGVPRQPTAYNASTPPHRAADSTGIGNRLQKRDVPAAPSGTATLLRLSPSHQIYP